ncbi:Vitamin K epoxide reductase [Nakamurella silvestris]|nr:Vitamin K epoxide reductase [Nakamurella silvestris]
MEENRSPTQILVPRGIGWLLLIGGLVGAVASFVLTADKVHLLEDPSYVPGCSINAQFSCGSVMTSWQASLFGFPNSLIGLAAFPVVAALGALLLGGVRLPRWVWWSLQAGALFAVVLVHWLMIQSVYEIGALCLYCMAVWTVTIPIFWYVTLTTVGNDPATLAGADEDEIRAGRISLPRWHVVVPVLWLAAIALIVVLKFA